MKLLSSSNIPISELNLDSIMGEGPEQERGQSQHIPESDVNPDGKTSEEDEFDPETGGLPHYPELRKGPATQGPRALTPPPPSPPTTPPKM